MEQVCIFIFREYRLFVLLFGGDGNGAVFFSLIHGVSWVCASSSSCFYEQILSVFCCRGSSLLCYSCGPASTRERCSAYHIHPTRSWSCSSCSGTLTACQHNNFMSLLTEVFVGIWTRLCTFDWLTSDLVQLVVVRVYLIQIKIQNTIVRWLKYANS